MCAISEDGLLPRWELVIFKADMAELVVKDFIEILALIIL